jgi:hypothetical protein
MYYGAPFLNFFIEVSTGRSIKKMDKWRQSGSNPAIHLKRIELPGEATKAEVSDGGVSANPGIDRPVRAPVRSIAWFGRLA